MPSFLKIDPLRAAQLTGYYLKTSANKYDNIPVFKSLADLIREKGSILPVVDVLNVVQNDVLRILVAQKIGSFWFSTKDGVFSFSSQEEAKSYISDKMMVKFSGNALKEVVDTLASDLNEWWGPKHEIIMKVINEEPDDSDRIESPHQLLEKIRYRQMSIEQKLSIALSNT